VEVVGRLHLQRQGWGAAPQRQRKKVVLETDHLVIMRFFKMQYKIQVAAEVAQTAQAVTALLKTAAMVDLEL
jgi:hypothetical protein